MKLILQIGKGKQAAVLGRLAYVAAVTAAERIGNGECVVTLAAKSMTTKESVRDVLRLSGIPFTKDDE